MVSGNPFAAQLDCIAKLRLKNQSRLCDLFSHATALNTPRAQVSPSMLTAALRCGLAVTRKVAAVVHRVHLNFSRSVVTSTALSTTASTSSTTASIASSTISITFLKDRLEHVRLPQSPLIAALLGHIAPDVDDLLDRDLQQQR
jgi:hypothetical protein